MSTIQIKTRLGIAPEFSLMDFDEYFEVFKKESGTTRAFGECIQKFYFEKHDSEAKAKAEKNVVELLGKLTERAALFKLHGSIAFFPAGSVLSGYIETLESTCNYGTQGFETPAELESELLETIGFVIGNGRTPLQTRIAECCKTCGGTGRIEKGPHSTKLCISCLGVGSIVEKVAESPRR